MNYKIIKNDQEPPSISTSLSDYALISNPILNKGMAFSEKERDLFHLHGIVPAEITTIETQRLRAYTTFKNKCSDLERYIFLRDVQDSNETLFYHVVTHAIEECMPIIYTPTVGEGCVNFSRIYRRPRGLYLSYSIQNHFDDILANPRFQNTKVIVVSDGERILGLGDLGAGGMGIPIGKLSLYTACAGIHPSETLPILLDVGTNNPDLLNDPLYIGWRHERIRGERYDQFIDHFIKAVKKRFPHVLLQWEDFSGSNATTLLHRYRNQICSFNDDIQGTAAVAMGTLLSAIRKTDSHLTDQKIVIFGAGGAGCGIASLLKTFMIKQGLSKEEALQRLYLIDRKGLLLTDMDDLTFFQKPFAKPKEDFSSWSLENSNLISLYDVVKHVHPTLLIGVSGQSGAFNEKIIREMAHHTSKPIIFPLSNPTSKSEATPADLLLWTEGRAIIGTGSPFPKVIKNGIPVRIDQTNNSYIFPGIGLGIIATKAKSIPDSIFMVAAQTLSLCVSKSDMNLLPPLSNIREISFQIALAVGKEAIQLGLSDCSLDQLDTRIRKEIWEPVYMPYQLK